MAPAHRQNRRETAGRLGGGQGGDVAALREGGIEAWGWDPHHAPDGRLDEADVVNLGFVINVIEDPQERAQTLRRAWSFAKKVLAVSTMVVGRTPLNGLRAYKDGFLTRRATFQKYYVQDELRSFIAEVTGETPLAMAPGIFAVFRHKDEEQEWLLSRRSSLRVVPPTMRPPPRPPRVTVRPSIADRVRPQLEELFQVAIRRGRMPEANEVPADTATALRNGRVAHARALALCVAEFGSTEIEAAAALRKEDLRVHIALTLLPGAPAYQALPQSLQRDVRALFGSHAQALAEARELLFSAGKEEVLRAAAAGAEVGGLGVVLARDRFRFASGRLGELPAVLRCVVGCAEALQGGIDTADVVEIRLDRPMVVAIACEDFTRPLPIIRERVRVDLARLRVEVRRPHDGERRVLLPKAPLMPEAGRAKQEQIEARLRDLGFFGEGMFDPAEGDLRQLTSRISSTGFASR